MSLHRGRNGTTIEPGLWTDRRKRLSITQGKNTEMNRAQGSAANLRGDIAFAFGLAVLCYLAWQLRAVLLLLYVSALAAVVLTPVVRATSHFRVGRWRPFRGRAILILMLARCRRPYGIRFSRFSASDSRSAGIRHEMPTRLPAFLEKLKHVPFADQVNTDEISGKIQDFISNAATYLLLSIKNWAGAIFSIAMGLILTVYFILEGDRRISLGAFLVSRRQAAAAGCRTAACRSAHGQMASGAGKPDAPSRARQHHRVCEPPRALRLRTRSIDRAAEYHSRAGRGCQHSVWRCSWRPLTRGDACWGSQSSTSSGYRLRTRSSCRGSWARSVGLPGLSILVALLIGSELGGVLGAIVSVPTAVLVSVLIDEYLVHKDATGDNDEGGPGQPALIKLLNNELYCVDWDVRRN